MALCSVVLGGGCFWCTEAVFRRLKGVKSATPGYAGGSVANPTYEQVCSGKTGHVEVVKVEYDPSVVPFRKLLELFFAMHDPTSRDGQGNDRGTQYRSAIFYTTEEQKKEAEGFMGEIAKGLSKPIATELRRLTAFYPAEEYHQDYYSKNPLQPYCALVIYPKLAKLQKRYGIG